MHKVFRWELSEILELFNIIFGFLSFCQILCITREDHHISETSACGSASFHGMLGPWSEESFTVWCFDAMMSNHSQPVLFMCCALLLPIVTTWNLNEWDQHALHCRDCALPWLEGFRRRTLVGSHRASRELQCHADVLLAVMCCASLAPSFLFSTLFLLWDHWKQTTCDTVDAPAQWILAVNGRAWNLVWTWAVRSVT